MERVAGTIALGRMVKEFRHPAAIAMGFAIAAFVYLSRAPFLHSDWIPLHDTLTQYTEFLYALSAFRHGELPLWNSYLYGGQPFYLLLNHGLLFTPIVWTWFFLGSLFQLQPPQIFAAYHMTEVLTFAFGGYAFTRTLLRSKYAAAVCFLVLLFSGLAESWKTQTYPLAIVVFLPWLLFFALRYARKQSLNDILAAALLFGIAGNSYYPSYLLFFLFALLAGLLLFYHRLVRSQFDFRRFAVHCCLTAPLIALLLLPTYWTYLEITGDYYQISRYGSAEEQESAEDPAAPSPFLTVRDAGAFVLNIAAIDSTKYQEELPFVGVSALVLALYGMLYPKRRSVFWLFLAALLVLSYYKNQIPHAASITRFIPYYSIIRSPTFFSGQLIFCIAMLAAIGAQSLASSLSFLRRRSPAKLLYPAILICILWGGMLGIMPSSDRAIPSIAFLLTAGAIALSRISTGSGITARRAVGFAILLGPLLVGIHNQHLTERKLMTQFRHAMFSYSDDFTFSFTRPPQFTVVQPIENPSECCATNFHIAEKKDAPFFFDVWKSAHTLFVSKDYYKAVAVPGTEKLMRNKLLSFSSCTETSTIPDYSVYLQNSILPIPPRSSANHALCESPRSQQHPANRQPASSPSAALLYKTANDVGFTVSTNSRTFLLYTDTFHPGFFARVDGIPRELLKGMGFLKAVVLEPGVHRVEFLFRPTYRYVLHLYFWLCCIMAAGLAIHGMAVGKR